MGESRQAIPITVKGITYPSRGAACKALGVNQSTFTNRCLKGEDPVHVLLNPPKKRPKRNWEYLEERALVRYASIMTAKELGKLLGRSAHSVERKAKAMEVSLQKSGEFHNNAKLTNLQVSMIHTLIDDCFTSADIHRELFPSLSLSIITDIKSGRTHKE